MYFELKVICDVLCIFSFTFFLESFAYMYIFYNFEDVYEGLINMGLIEIELFV